MRTFAICDVCGVDFEQYTIKQKRCSRKCASIYTKENYWKLPQLKDFQIFNRDKFTCIYCGKSAIEDGVKLHIEHIIPYSKGGGFEYDNLITSCERCNLCKGSKELDEDIVIRLKSIVNERNKLMTHKQIILLQEEINKLKKSRP